MLAHVGEKPIVVLSPTLIPTLVCSPKLTLESRGKLIEESIDVLWTMRCGCPEAEIKDPTQLLGQTSKADLLQGCDSLGHIA